MNIVISSWHLFSWLGFREAEFGEILLCKYINSDYVGHGQTEIYDWICFYNGKRPTCWMSILQSTVTLLTTEAEYMMVIEVMKEARHDG